MMLPVLERPARPADGKEAGAPLVGVHEPMLLVAPRRLAGVHVEALRDAERLLERARAQANQLRSDAQAQAHALRETARAEGAEQGRREALIALLGTPELGRRLQEMVGERLADVVEHALRQLVGEPRDASFMRRRIEHLLKSGEGASSAGPSAAATLRCHPADFPMVRSAAAAIPRGLRLVSDAGRPPGSLLLQVGDRFLESDLALTLKQSCDLVRQAVAQCPWLCEGTA